MGEAGLIGGRGDPEVRDRIEISRVRSLIAPSIFKSKVLLIFTPGAKVPKATPLIRLEDVSPPKVMELAAQKETKSDHSTHK